VIWRLLLWIGVILTLTACQANQAVPPEVIPSSTLPPDVEAGDLYVNEETERKMAELRASKPGGITLGIRSTYEEMVPDSYTTFRVKQGQPFLGEFFLRSAKQEKHSYIFLCLLDHIQIPCSPGEKLFQFVEEVTDGDTIEIPIQIPIQDEGLHDLIVVYQEDPYLAGPVGSGSFQDRTLRDLNQMRASISVNGLATVPYLDYEEPPGQSGYGSIPRGFVASGLKDPRGPQGGWIIWTEDTAEAGELFDFFLHFDSAQDRKYALVAFIDFQQVPIYVNGGPRLPLYIQTHASTWHPMPVQIRAPRQPGRYELRLLAIGEPFTRLDLLSGGERANLTDYPQSSPRILLEVK
jgi:hypothetical protein